jgi:hypothetical protein
MREGGDSQSTTSHRITCIIQNSDIKRNKHRTHLSVPTPKCRPKPNPFYQTGETYRQSGSITLSADIERVNEQGQQGEEKDQGRSRGHDRSGHGDGLVEGRGWGRRNGKLMVVVEEVVVMIAMSGLYIVLG